MLVAESLVADRRDGVLFALMLGLLPWLHRKYAPYGLALVFAVVWAHRIWLKNSSHRQLLTLAALYLLPQLLLIAFTWYVWGNVGGALMLERAPFSSRRTGRGSSDCLSIANMDCLSGHPFTRLCRPPGC